MASVGKRRLGLQKGWNALGEYDTIRRLHDDDCPKRTAARKKANYWSRFGLMDLAGPPTDGSP